MANTIILLIFGFMVTCSADYWTSWLDRDNPTGLGDYETVASAISWGLLAQSCNKPKAVRARIRDRPGGLSGQDGESRNKLAYYDIANGVVCKNADQTPVGRYPIVSQYRVRCHNYQVSFLCPGNRPPPRIGYVNPVSGKGKGNAGKQGGVQVNGDETIAPAAVDEDETVVEDS